LVDYYVVEKRHIDLSVDYVPEEPTLDDEVTVIANVFDLGLGEPADGLKVEFCVYSMQEDDWLYMGYSYTNSSGVATFTWIPRDYLEETGGLAYFVLSVRVVETACTKMAEEVPVSVDTRYLTRLEFLMGGDVTDVAVGEECHLFVELVRADDGSPVDGVLVNLYIDGVKTSWAVTGATGIPGVAEWWPWVVEEEGVYHYTARFEDWNVLYQPSDEARLVVVAEVVPLYILFVVQPRDFKPGTSLTLTAQVNDSRSGEPLSGSTVRFYAVDEGGGKARIDDGSIETNENGVATLTWTYVLGPYAFVAEVAAGQSMISSPVMLNVAKETGLGLDVEKDESSFDHTFSGCLLSYGEPVLYRQVKILVNDTVEAVLATNPDGSFSLTLNLQPVDDKPTAYNVQAVFEGDEPCGATAYAFMPNGTEYAVCTTSQYGFKPSSNSTWLTVEPQSTQVMQSTKTPEQMQQEAEDEGWLKPPRPWFSWWYPWFRLYYTMVYNGQDILEIGLSPIGGDDIIPSSTFNDWLNDAINDLIAYPIVKAYLIGFITGEIAACAGMYGGPPGFIAGLALSLAIKAGLLLATWDSAEGLKGAFVGAVFSLAYGFITTLKKVVDLGITAISELLNLLKVSELNFWRLIFKFIHIPINMYFLIRIIFRIVELGDWQL